MSVSRFVCFDANGCSFRMCGLITLKFQAEDGHHCVTEKEVKGLQQQIHHLTRLKAVRF